MCVCLWNNFALRGGAFGWDTTLQAGSWPFRFPTGSLILQAARFYLISNRNKYQDHLLGRKGGRYLGLTLPFSGTYCLEIMGASTSWSPQVLSRDYFTLLHLCKIELNFIYPCLCLTILLFPFLQFCIYLLSLLYMLRALFRLSPFSFRTAVSSTDVTFVAGFTYSL